MSLWLQVVEFAKGQKNLILVDGLPYNMQNRVQIGNQKM